MMSYRFARRSFLASIGGAFGLEILLRNMEAGAMGAGPPPRFLMMHWPSGTLRTQFVPNGTGMSYTTSPAPEGSSAATNRGAGYIISPFDTPELRPLTTILYGLTTGSMSGRGGGHEDGTPFATTGSNSPGTRQNGGETDDGCAGGPSWDQILLKNVPELSRRSADGTIIGRGYYNTICDARIDSYETSTRCLSYGYTKVSVASAIPSGTIQENQPLRPQLSPVTAYNDLFSGFMPGGGPMTDMNALRLLRHKKSVLDHSLRELNRLNTLAPASERTKIESHAAVIRQIEAQLSEQINNPPTTGTCTLPMMPDPAVVGKSADRLADYGNPIAKSDDAPVHEQVGNAHAGILRAAFACDLIRVATFQWSPGTNHVSFKGLDPNSPDTIYMHHPLSHAQTASSFFTGSRPSNATNVWDAMVAANYWYFLKTAAIINTFRTQIDPLDPMGGSLLSRTVIPMVTEVGDASHNRAGHGALIVGGQALGMRGGEFRMVSGNHNQLWTTVAQAYLGANAVNALASESYVKANPISGLWAAPT
jgi:hypothetical protein